MESSSLKEAVKYISGELKADPAIDKNALIDEASRRFDLNPMQTEFLINKYILGA
ncbi:MAG TPA: hypothetical protein PKM65_10490 [Spirochaetota bacterium]|nr:hypothetical protein [Spirochaetota bacterium]HNT12271.1 hypothetical protein [Spirochaetota bacterium]HNV47045.1 hypothetical protein [Spirochaetota bacterium]HOS38620.1 hypothetical protein [Spirochaetota bacterium]HPI22811.1 hypothetical protein [Spirochaetota bacterium]